MLGRPQERSRRSREDAFRRGLTSCIRTPSCEGTAAVGKREFSWSDVVSLWRQKRRLLPFITGEHGCRDCASCCREHRSVLSRAPPINVPFHSKKNKRSKRHAERPSDQETVQLLGRNQRQTVEGLKMEAKISKIKAYRGLCVAPFTPFDGKGNININLIDEYVSLLRKQSVTGAFVNGSTGEGLSLTVAERKKLAERWVEASRGKLDLVIVHVTAASILDTQELATHAESLNVDAISVLPPFYFRSPSIDHLIRYVQEVAKAAPNTPIIYYHIPAFTFVNVRMTEFLPEAKRRVPALCGAKYSCSELSDLAGFLRADKADIKIFFGYEEMLLAALALGVTAAIGGTFTYQGHLAKKIIDLYNKGDMDSARHHQDKLKHGIDTLGNHGFSVAALKAAANKVSGLNFGNTRMPVCPLSDDQAEKLAEEIRALDILI